MDHDFPTVDSDNISQIKESFKNKFSPFDDRNETVRPPIKFCQLIAEHPRKAFALSSAVYVIGIIASVALIFFGFDLFPTRFAGIKMEVRTKSYVQRNKAFLDRKSAPNFLPRVEFGTQEIAIPESYFEVMFQTTNGSNILTTSHMRSIDKVQKQILKSKDFEKYCLRSPRKSGCVPPNSLVSMLDGNYENIAMMMYFINQDPTAVTALQQVLGNDTVLNTSHAITTSTRIQFVFGGPLNNSKNKEDDKLRCEKYLKEEVMPLLQKFAENPPPGLRIYYFGKAFLDVEIERYTYTDMILIVGSFTFILILLCIHTKSLFLGACGMASIVGSFVLANLVYRLIIGFVYFGVCHVLSIFVILGIGADDIFVFVDTWKQAGVTSKYKFPSSAHRLSHVYRQAATATALTSLTTIIALLASAMSPILAISSFGVFSALLVLLTYVSVITFFPTAVMYAHCVIKCKWSQCSCCCRKHIPKVPQMTSNAYMTNGFHEKTSNGHTQNGDIPIYGFQNNMFSNYGVNLSNGLTPVEQSEGTLVNGYIRDETSPSFRLTLPDLLNVRDRWNNTFKPKPDSQTYPKTETTYNADYKIDKRDVFKHENIDDTLKIKSFGVCVRFFRGPLFHLLTHRIFRWFILSAFVGLIGVASYFTSQLVPEDRQVKLLNPDTDIMRANELRIHGFMASPPDAIFEARVIWGLKPQDLSNCRFREDDDCVGKLRLDTTFDMNSDEAQLALRDFCLKFRNPTKNMIDNLRLRLNPADKKPIFSCFLLDMEKYLKRFLLELPLNASNVRPFMERRPHLYDLSKLSPDFNRYFEVMLTYWLTDGYLMSVRQPMVKYDAYLGEVNSSDAQLISSHRVKSHWGGSLAYMIISAETTLNFHVLGYPEGFKVGAAWDKFINQEMKLMPSTSNKAFAESRKWRGLAISEALAKNAWQGIVIGISTSLFILTLTTMNIVVALIATLTIGLITNCVIAAIVLASWKLGPLESINMCLVVGLAVDYVVHLAEAYNRSLHSDRISRVRDALEQVGVSVLSGAMTSLGASLFMIFANILFFVQFGIFMFITIGMSFLFAIGFFCTFMGIFGPEGTFGDLNNCCRKKDKKVETTVTRPIHEIPLRPLSLTVTNG